jgi:serine/threonine kinase 4
MGDPDIEF